MYWKKKNAKITSELCSEEEDNWRKIQNVKNGIGYMC